MGGVGDLGPEDGATLDGITFHTYPFGTGRGTLGYLGYSRKMNRDVFERTIQSFPADVLFFMQPLSTNAVMRSPLAQGARRAYHFFSPWAREWKIGTSRNGERSGLWAAMNVTFRRMSERKALNHVVRVLCASRYMKSQLLEQHPAYPEARITILSGAVDVGQFRPIPVQRSEDQFTIFTMRRLVHRMGLDLLIRAVHAIPNAHLVIGGNGPERESLQALVAELNLGDRISFVGYVPDAELPRRYTEADLVVLPTRQLEGFGLVLIEAMACGTPAMGTNIGGIPEVVGPLDPDLVIPEPTVEAITASINRYRDDLDWQRSLRERCRDYVVDRFSWEKIIPVLEEALS